MATITGVAGTTINAQCTVSNAGQFITQAESSTTAQSICNDLATISTGNVTLAGVKTFSSAPDLDAGATIAQTFALTAEGTGCNLSGIWATPPGSTLACASGGGWVVASGGSLSCNAGSKTNLLGRVIPRSARVPVADSTTKTLGVAAGSGVDFAGKRFVFASPASPRTRTLKSTTVVPDEGETIECIWSQTVGFGGGTQFTIQREDATVVATFVGAVGGEVTAMYCWAEFEFVGGVWKLGATSGFAVDSTDALFGVVPGAGA